MSFQYSNPKVAGRIFVQNGANQGISTHSRPKATVDTRSGGLTHAQFQHTAARRRLPHSRLHIREIPCFNTQPPEGGWAQPLLQLVLRKRFNTQPPKGGWEIVRPVFAGRCRFNTQPPKGGWIDWFKRVTGYGCFNTQPPKGGWGAVANAKIAVVEVSTHSRLKAAGYQQLMQEQK